LDWARLLDLGFGMADQRRSGFCQHCKKSVVVFRPGPNHIFHLIMTVITGGLWLIVWIGASVIFGGWRCSVCGGTSLKNIN
jgi:hypothetical protein